MIKLVPYQARCPRCGRLHDFEVTWPSDHVRWVCNRCLTTNITAVSSSVLALGKAENMAVRDVEDIYKTKKED